MPLSLPARSVLHPIRSAPLLTRALVGLEPLAEYERPFAGIDSLLHRPSHSHRGPVSAICFEIANLEDIAQIAGLDVARRASEIVSDRLVAGIGGPHALERPDERRFLVAAPMELEAAVDLARKVMDGLSRPIVLDKMSVHVAIAAMVGNRRAIDSRLAAAA